MWSCGTRRGVTAGCYGTRRHSGPAGSQSWHRWGGEALGHGGRRQAATCVHSALCREPVAPCRSAMHRKLAPMPSPGTWAATASMPHTGPMRVRRTAWTHRHLAQAVLRPARPALAACAAWPASGSMGRGDARAGAADGAGGGGGAQQGQRTTLTPGWAGGQAAQGVRVI